MDRDRSAVLARRARFIAAALAGVSPAPVVRADPGDAGLPPSGSEPTPGNAEPSDAEARPQICLSPDEIEGELRPCRAEPDRPDCALTVRGPEMPPRVCLSIAPPSANRDYQHDGFYLRMGPIAGLLRVAADDESASGGAYGGELALGMTVAPGVVVGLGSVLLHAPSPSSSVSSATLFQLGPFVSVYFDPRRGWHASLVLAPNVIAMGTPDADASGVGGGAGLWLGYDAFVAPDWSLGVAVGGLVGFARTERDGTSEALQARALTVSLTLLWH